MRLPSNVRDGELSFNMTPMIDVVFLLIIFFLVSSHLAKQEAQMELPLPVADSGTQLDGSQERRLTLNVIEDGSLLLAGRRIELDQLQVRLTQVRSNEQADVEVRLRSDRNVPYRLIEPILLACARAGVWNVTFGVYRSGDVP
jgi:biopolymer transport protein ExbD